MYTIAPINIQDIKIPGKISSQLFGFALHFLISERIFNDTPTLATINDSNIIKLHNVIINILFFYRSSIHSTGIPSSISLLLSAFSQHHRAPP